MITVKLNKQQDKLEVYDNDNIYWYSISQEDLIKDAGFSVKESKQIIDSHKPKSGDADHCYGCATMRKPCSGIEPSNWQEILNLVTGKKSDEVSQ